MTTDVTPDEDPMGVWPTVHRATVANINPETGIRYGIVAADSLDPDVVNELQMSGKDLHYEEAKSELWDAIKRVCEDYMGDRDSDDVADQAVERMSEDWSDDEPVHSFDLQGVKGQTTWLGGALMVWCFESPHTGVFQLCSPCVPGACDLDSPVNPLRETIGHIGYTVPDDWLRKDHAAS